MNKGELEQLEFEVKIRRSSKKVIDAIIVRHLEEEVIFHGRETIKLEGKKDRVEDEENIYECFNKYIDATHSKEQKRILFEAYKELESVVEADVERDYQKDILYTKPIVNKILLLVDPDKYFRWISYSPYLRVPSNLAEAASKGDYPVQTTITDEDYVNLVMLAFITRTIYPAVFSLQSRFIPRLGKDTAELVCGDLIKDNPIIINSPGWIKLNLYIDHTFARGGVPIQALDVTSNENFCDKVLFNTLFSRLCVSVIPESEPNKNIATSISGGVRNHEKAGSSFRTKDIRINDNEDKRSIYEKYNITENTKFISQVTQAEFFSFGLFNEKDEELYKNRFKYQCKALGIKNEKLVEKVYDNLPLNWDFFMYDHILKILQLTYYGVVSPFIFEACDYEQLTAAIVLAQVKLSEEGYSYLPSLLGAIEDPNGMINVSDGFRLTSSEREVIASLSDVQTRNHDGTSFNEAVEAVTEFLERLGNGKWQSNLEYGVLDNLDFYNRVKPYNLFPIDVELEIKEEFIRLVTTVNT